MSNIPKIIHYCWFGDNEKPELIKKCIASWKKYLPDYQIKEWNNSDLEYCEVQYVKDAIKEKKWAFVSDYYRLYALYTMGGIYLDSDNEVFKSFDDFLGLLFFTGYEIYKKEKHSFTAVVGAKKGNHIIKDLLEEYNELSFYKDKGVLNLDTNTQRVENYFQKKYNLKPPFETSKKIELEENCILFPANYFCNYDPDVSYAVHHFNGSWVPNIVPHKRKFIFDKFYIKIYTIKQGFFWKEVKSIEEVPVFAYPRIGKNSVVITLGKEENERRHK